MVPFLSPLPFLVVFVGAGLGGVLRHGVNLASARLFGLDFPWGTLFINASGSLAMGLLVEFFALRFDPGQHWRLLATTGFLGGFTTFSTFSLEAVMLFEAGRHLAAAAYVLGSVATGLAGLVAGFALVRALS